MLNTKIISHHIEYLSPLFVLVEKPLGQQRLAHLAARIGGVKLVVRLGRDHPRQVGAIHLADALGLLDESHWVRNAGRDHAAHHALGAQVPHQSPRVDLGQHRHRVALHVLVGHLLGAPVGADGGELADNQALNIRPRRLIIGTIGAVVADLGIGQDDDLPCVGGIGGNFLVTSEGSIKNHFAPASAWVPMALAAEDAPVFER
jgi:hypothetical protein